MGIQNWWNNRQRKANVLGEKPVSSSLCTGQESNRGIHGEKPAPNCLIRGTARRLKLICIIECTIIAAQCVPPLERPGGKYCIGR